MAHILIIDDDPAVGLTFARMLASDGHDARVVESAQAGLERVSSNPPDAILLDMRMPVMSGLEFLRRLRLDVGLTSLPVGIVTGDYFLNEAVLAEIETLGASIRYKPVWMEDLAELMQTLLNRRPDWRPGP